MGVGMRGLGIAVVVAVGVTATSPPAALAGGRVQLAPARQAHPFAHALRASRTFQMIGARWSGTGAVDLRARRLHGGWSRWVSLSQEAPAWTGPARRIRLRRRGGV